jgi:hypothetical protein
VTTRTLAPLALAACCVACAPLTRLPYQPDQPPTATLPAVLAGVKDERAAFGRLFGAELRRSPGRASDTAANWLHGVAPSAQPHDGARLDASFSARAAATAVLIVPGLFGDCVAAQSVPFGDGQVRTPERSVTEGYRHYEDLALASIRMVPLPGRAPSSTNGRLLADAIRAQAADAAVRRIVLVAYSKGTADALRALEFLDSEGALSPKLAALVSVAGVVMGTPVADNALGVYEAVSPWVTPLDCTPDQDGDLASVTRQESIRWLAAHPPPPDLAYFSVVAHARRDEMAPPLRVVSAQLANIDARNDGQVVAADAVLPGSVLLAEAHADHWDVALPRNRHPDLLVRAWTSGRDYPREALLRAILKWVIAAGR